MDFYTFIDNMNVGAFGCFALRNEFIVGCGDLPDIPYGYSLPKISNDEDVLLALEHMKKINKDIDKRYPNAGKEIYLGINDYEAECFFLEFIFSSIFDYWFGKLKPSKDKYEDKSLHTEFDLLAFTLWDYLNGEESLDKLKESSQKFYVKCI